MSTPQRATLPEGLRERGKAERHQRIREAARAVFLEKGFEGATTREIAVRAQVGVGTVFVYANDKNELLQMVLNDELETTNERAFATLPKDGTLMDQLLHIFASRYRLWAEDPDLSRHALQEAYGPTAGLHEGRPETQRFLARRSRTIDGLSAIIAQKKKEHKLIADVDASLVGHLVYDVYVGENRKWLSERNPVARRGLTRLRDLLALALCGIASPSELAAKIPTNLSQRKLRTNTMHPGKLGSRF